MVQTRYISWIPAPSSIKRIGKIHAWLYEHSFGIIGGRLDGLDILLLTTTGRKSGRARSVPLPYFRDGAGFVLVGSYGGNQKNPAWYTNLVANPEVRVQLGARRWATRAHVAQGAERERLWAEITREFPRYLVYQARTTRQIPLVRVSEPAAVGSTDTIRET